MIGSKKKKEKEEQEKKEEEEQEPTPIQEAKIQTQDKQELTAWTLKEFTSTYNGLISPEELKDIDTETTELNLLIGIFSELRMMREIMSQKK